MQSLDHDKVPVHPRVSVLTPVRNEERDLPETIAAMQRQSIGDEVEFIFIDGESTDRTVDLILRAAAEDGRIRMLSNPDRRTPQALNIGLDAARGTYIARMDAHTIYPPNYLESGVARLVRGDAAWVSGPQLPLGRGRWSRRAALALGTRLGVGGASFRRALSEEITTDSGFTGLWRKSLLDELGGWDEHWPINQDGELAARIRERGLEIVCIPEMAAQYIPRDSLRALARQYWRYGQYRCKTSVRHPRSMRRSHALAPGLVVTACASLLPGRRGKPFRRMLALYAAAVLTSVAPLGRTSSAADAAGAGVVLVVTHFAWGAGFITGIARFGAPLHGFVSSMIPRRASASLARPRRPDA